MKFYFEQNLVNSFTNESFELGSLELFNASTVSLYPHLDRSVVHLRPYTTQLVSRKCTSSHLATFKSRQL